MISKGVISLFQNNPLYAERIHGLITSFTPVITYILINGMFVFWEEEVPRRWRRERKMRMTRRREGRKENYKNERNFFIKKVEDSTHT